MTPVGYAAAILKSLQDVAGVGNLPTPQVTGAGDAVIACAETRVAFQAVVLEPNSVNSWACEVAETGTYLVSIARECAWTANEDGSEDYDALAAVTTLVDADVAALIELFKAIGFGVEQVDGGAVGWGATRTGQITTVSTGALVITTLTLTVGVP